jgi:hypothetical protein
MPKRARVGAPSVGRAAKRPKSAPAVQGGPVPARFRRQKGPKDRKQDYARWCAHLADRKEYAQEHRKPYFEHDSFRVKLGLIKSLTGITAHLEKRFHNRYSLPKGDGGGAGRQGGSDAHFDLAFAYTFKEECKTDMGRMIKRALDTRGYRFVQAETPVMCGRWGTAADGVFKTPEGETVVVEYKTGMGHAFTGHEKRSESTMSAPLEKYLMCPVHAGLLQAYVTAIMFETTFGAKCGVRVVHVADQTVTIYGDASKERDFRAAAARFIQTQPV